MISSNTRATRSRFSSPAQSQPPPASQSSPLEVSKSLGNDASRSFMKRWLEPSVQSKPSYEEAGLVRYGVLENMAPLGSLPKPKKGTNELGTGVRKVILKPPPPSKDEEEEAEFKPPKAKRQATSSAKEAASRLQQLRSEEKVEEEDEGTGDEGLTNGSRRRNPRRVSAAPVKQTYEEPRIERESSPVATKIATPQRGHRASIDGKSFTSKVIDVAVDEALKHYRYPTAWALKTLHDDNMGDTEFESMVTDVFNQTADVETLDEFNRQVEEKKREGKRDNQGCYYFVPPSTNSRFTPHKPKAAPYSRLLVTTDDDECDIPVAKKIKTSHMNDTSEEVVVVVPATNGIKLEDEAQNVLNMTPSRKRARRNSASSESSLSSAQSLSSPEVRLGSLSPSLRKVTRAKGATSAGAPSQDRPKSRPITSRDKSTKHVTSNTTLPNSPPSPSFHNISSSAHGSMPGRLAASELFPNLKSGSEPPSLDEARASPVHHEDDDTVWKRRKTAQTVTNNYVAAESSVRGSKARGKAVTTPAKKTRRTRQSLAAPTSTRSTRSAVKKSGDDADVPLSPATLSMTGDDKSGPESRAVTPVPGKKGKGGLRVKSSPVKKSTGAGVPRPVGEPQSSASNGAGTPKDPTADNDEYCSACGSAGDVLCCDGCPRSFHFECVDLVQSDDLPDDWFCNECIVRKFPSRVPIHKGTFGSALNNLEKSIPKAFSLPKKVQTRFEGVKAAADGDYEEVSTNKGPKKRAGQDDVPDFFKQREDNQAVLCHSCQKPSTENRAILPCSACPLYWHLDCLDPPMAVPPVLKTWRCPAHVDDVLSEAPSLAPAHKFRKVKNTQVIAPVYTRGMRNNGHVEIDWSDEPDTFKHAGWPDPLSFGRTYKVSASGVVLDFIEQLRKQGAGYGARQDEPKWVPYGGVSPNTHTDPTTPLLGSELGREVDEMQVSLNLVGLKRQRSEGIDQLTSALLSSADDNVLALMARSSADNLATGNLTDDDKTGLRAMLAQMDAMGSRIRQMLGDKPQSPNTTSTNTNTTPTPIPGAATPPAEPSTSPERQKKDTEQDANAVLVTEPTPPSTVDHGEGAMELD